MGGGAGLDLGASCTGVITVLDLRFALDLWWSDISVFLPISVYFPYPVAEERLGISSALIRSLTRFWIEDEVFKEEDLLSDDFGFSFCISSINS